MTARLCVRFEASRYQESEYRPRVFLEGGVRAKSERAEREKEGEALRRSSTCPVCSAVATECLKIRPGGCTLMLCLLAPWPVGIALRGVMVFDWGRRAVT